MAFNKVDNSERVALTFAAVTSTLVGLAGGLALALRLDGNTIVQADFWKTLLTVSALGALPLVAAATGLARLWRGPEKDGQDPVTFLALAPLVMLGAAAISLLEVVLCLHQIAVTDKSSNPDNLVVYFTTIPAGAILGAAVFGVSWAILDKMDDPES